MKYLIIIYIYYIEININILKEKIFFLIVLSKKKNYFIYNNKNKYKFYDIFKRPLYTIIIVIK